MIYIYICVCMCVVWKNIYIYIHSIFHHVGETDLRRYFWWFGTTFKFHSLFSPNPFLISSHHGLDSAWAFHILSSTGELRKRSSARGQMPRPNPSLPRSPRGQGADQGGGAKLVRPVFLDAEGRGSTCRGFAKVKQKQQFNMAIMAGNWKIWKYMPFTVLHAMYSISMIQ